MRFFCQLAVALIQFFKSNARHDDDCTRPKIEMVFDDEARGALNEFYEHFIGLLKVHWHLHKIPLRKPKPKIEGTEIIKATDALQLP